MTGGGAVVSIMMGMLLTKNLALSGGAAQVGFFSLARGSIQTLAGLSIMYGTTAIVQGMNHNQKANRCNYIVSTAILVSLMTAMLCVAVWFWAPLLAKWLLSRNDTQSYQLVRGFIPAIFFSAFTLYFGALLNSYRRIGQLALVQVSSTAAGALVAYPLIGMGDGLWGIIHLLWIMTATGFVASLTFIWQEKEIIFSIKQLRSQWDAEAATYFLKFAGASILTGLMAMGMVLLIRSMFVHHGGLSEAGVFDAAWTISTVYISILLTSLGTYYTPVLAGMDSVNERGVFIVKTLRLVSFSIVPLLLIAIFLKSIAIRLLYSAEFASSGAILTWLLIGDFLKATIWVFATPIQAFAHLRLFLATELLSGSMIIAGIWLMLFEFNKPEYIGLVFITVYSITIGFLYNYVKNEHGLKLTLRNKLSWVFGFSLVIVAALLTANSLEVQFGTVISFIPAVFLYFLTSTNQEERKKLFKMIAKRVSYE